MSGRRAACLLGVVTLLGSGLGACVPAASCDMVIVPADGPELDVLPGDAEPIVRATDVDPLGWRVIPDDGSGLGDQVVFRLHPEGAERLASFTRDNIGGWIGIAIDGRVVSVPMIAAPLEGGEVAVTGSGAGDVVEDFRSCLPLELLPTG